MSGLCGWLGAPTMEEPSRTLHTMANQLVRAAENKSYATAERESALHVQGRRGRSSLVADQTIWAAIEGHPRWGRQDLAAIAVQAGAAAALREAYLFRAFSFAVLDRSSNSLLLAIDRFGIHTLCYALAGKGIVFGSTTASAHPSVSATITPQTIIEFFAGRLLLAGDHLCRAEEAAARRVPRLPRRRGSNWVLQGNALPYGRRKMCRRTRGRAERAVTPGGPSRD
jgi:hypothetical protein